MSYFNCKSKSSKWDIENYQLDPPTNQLIDPGFYTIKYGDKYLNNINNNFGAGFVDTVQVFYYDSNMIKSFTKDCFSMNGAGIITFQGCSKGDNNWVFNKNSIYNVNLSFYVSVMTTNNDVIPYQYDGVTPSEYEIFTIEKVEFIKVDPGYYTIKNINDITQYVSIATANVIIGTNKVLWYYDGKYLSTVDPNSMNETKYIGSITDTTLTLTTDITSAVPTSLETLNDKVIITQNGQCLDFNENNDGSVSWTLDTCSYPSFIIEKEYPAPPTSYASGIYTLKNNNKCLNSDGKMGSCDKQVGWIYNKTDNTLKLLEDQTKCLINTSKCNDVNLDVGSCDNKENSNRFILGIDKTLYDITCKSCYNGGVDKENFSSCDDINAKKWSYQSFSKNHIIIIVIIVIVLIVLLIALLKYMKKI
jgi:hypothetical protein